MPLLPTPLSLRMLAQLVDFIRDEGWTDLTLLPFFSMVDRRRALHQELIASARAEFQMLLATEVPYRSEIERMSVRRAPLPAYAPQSDAALIYASLWAEICQRLRAARHSPAASGSRREVAARAAHALT